MLRQDSWPMRMASTFDLDRVFVAFIQLKRVQENHLPFRHVSLAPVACFTGRLTDDLAIVCLTFTAVLMTVAGMKNFKSQSVSQYSRPFDALKIGSSWPAADGSVSDKGCKVSKTMLAKHGLSVWRSNWPSIVAICFPYFFSTDRKMPFRFQHFNILCLKFCSKGKTATLHKPWKKASTTSAMLSIQPSQRAIDRGEVAELWSFWNEQTVYAWRQLWHGHKFKLMFAIFV